MSYFWITLLCSVVAFVCGAVALRAYMKEKRLQEKSNSTGGIRGLVTTLELLNSHLSEIALEVEKACNRIDKLEKVSSSQENMSTLHDNMMMLQGEVSRIAGVQVDKQKLTEMLDVLNAGANTARIRLAELEKSNLASEAKWISDASDKAKDIYRLFVAFAALKNHTAPAVDAHRDRLDAVDRELAQLRSAKKPPKRKKPVPRKPVRRKAKK